MKGAPGALSFLAECRMVVPATPRVHIAGRKAGDTHGQNDSPAGTAPRSWRRARAGEVVVAGDGQVSLGQTVIKGTARKVRRLCARRARGRRGLRRLDRRRLHPARTARDQARGDARPASARLRRACQGLAHRQVPAKARGHPDRHRWRRSLRRHRRGRRAGARTRRDRDRVGRQLRAGRRRGH
jgi:hypothetical protein